MAKKGHKGKRKKALAELAPTPVQTMPAHLRPRRAHVYDLDRQTEHVALNVLKAAAPGLQYLTTRYPRKWLRKDVIAGVAVAAYMVPQVLAYSAIVNVPPVAGLWSALAAIIAYAVMGGSRVLSAGPESTIALMAGAAIAPLAGGDPQRALSLSAALCLIVAGWCLVARVFRAGIVVELLSQPLLVGYLAGGAVLMIVGQLGKVTGTKVGGESIVDQIASFLSVVGLTKPLTLAVAAATLALILLVRRLRPSLPAPLIAVALATAVSAFLGLQEQGVAIVGAVPSGLPMPSLPNVSMHDVQALVLAGLGVAVVGYSDNMLIARGFPAPLEEGETNADVRSTRSPNSSRWPECRRPSACSAAIRPRRPGPGPRWPSLRELAVRSTRWPPACASSRCSSLQARCCRRSRRLRSGRLSSMPLASSSLRLSSGGCGISGGASSSWPSSPCSAP